jgi:hypothetical protein
MLELESNVVTIYGDDCDPRIASEQVIALLEDALQRAKSGEIVGVAIAAVHFDKSTGRNAAGQYNCCSLIGEMYKLLREIAR